MQVNSFVRMVFGASLATFAALAFVGCASSTAPPQTQTESASSAALIVTEGLRVDTEVVTCSQAAWSCTSALSVGLHLEVRQKHDVGIGDHVAAGITGADGTEAIALAPDTYQVFSDRVADGCAYGWMLFGDGCLGPKFVVRAGELTSLHLQFVQWTD